MPTTDPSLFRGGPVPWSELSPQLVAEELDRVVSSPAFRRSPRHTRFLRYLIEHSRASDYAGLREIVLGVAVFQRNAARFDPRRDTIVRVEARRLRYKLARYYAEEGATARLQFVLPLRSYAIEAHSRRNGADGPASRASVAVLQLDDATDDRRYGMLAAGTTSEIAGALERVNGLTVVAGTSLQKVGADRDPILLGRMLNVASVLRGSLTAAAQQIRVAVELVRTEDGERIWSNTVSATCEDLPRALEALARGVVSELQRHAQRRRLQMISLAGRRPYVRTSGNGEARDMMYRAQWCMREQTIDNFRRAAELFERAIALTAAANAYAGLAHALVCLVGATALPSMPTMESARRAALRALQVEPEHAGAWGTLGTILHSFDHDWPGAEAALLKSVRYGPGRAGAHSRYGWSLMFNRRFDEARAEYRNARELEPLDLTLRAHEALISLYERNYERADAELARALEIAPDHLIAASLRAALFLYRGHYQEGRTAYETLAAAHPRVSIGRCGLAQAAALLGDLDAAHAGLQWLRSGFEAGHVSPYQISMVCVRMNDRDEALLWLARAAQLRDFNFICIGVDPAFDPLRADPRFCALLRENGHGHLL